jgi:hypothetical protein
MGECTDCQGECRDEEQKEKELMPNITINITYNDNRVNEDHSNYVNDLVMDSDE